MGFYDVRLHLVSSGIRPVLTPTRAQTHDGETLRILTFEIARSGLQPSVEAMHARLVTLGFNSSGNGWYVFRFSPLTAYLAALEDHPNVVSDVEVEFPVTARSTMEAHCVAVVQDLVARFAMALMNFDTLTEYASVDDAIRAEIQRMGMTY